MIIRALILKDYYEYKNNFLKMFSTVIFIICLPPIMFNFFDLSNAFLRDMDNFIELMVIMFVTLILSETTLCQVRRDIRDGIYEKYFINKRIRKHEIYISKLISNLSIVYISFFALWSINVVLGFFSQNSVQFNININLILHLFISCTIGTSLGFLSSLIVTSDNNAMVYVGSLIVVYMGYYKILEILSITSYLEKMIGLIVIAALLTTIVMFLLKKNIFIRR